MKKITAVIILLSAILTVSGCGKVYSSNQNSTSQVATASSTAKQALSSQKETKTATIGEEFTLKNWGIQVTSFGFDTSVKEGLINSASENKYLLLCLSITNNGSSAENFIDLIGGVSVKAIYNGKYEYQTSTTTIKGDIANQTIQPMTTYDGFTMIKLPENLTDASESIVVVFENSGEKFQVTLE